MTEAQIDAALAQIRKGGLLAYPTETVWGLGADARSDSALRNLRAWKGRDPAAPVSILVAAAGALDALGFRWTPVARRRAEAFWPGPLTLVLGCRGSFAPGIARADGAVGVRCSPHPICRMLAEGAADRGVGPLTATSLNRSGEPAVRTLQAARELCTGTGSVPCLVDAAGDTAIVEDVSESTVVDVSESNPRVLRWGAITEADLSPFLSWEPNAGDGPEATEEAPRP